MGTCSGKGTVGGVTISVKLTLKMKRVGVASVDEFVDKCNELVESFGDIVDPLSERNEKIMRLAGFKNTKHATIKHALVGLFLSFAAAAQGDMNKLKIKFEDSPPYIKASLHGVSTEDLIECFEEFSKYITDLEAILLDKLPALVQSSMALVEAATSLVQNAQGEFEALSTFEKISAGAKTAIVAKDVVKIPNTIKKMILQFKDDIMDTKDAIQAIKDLNKIADDAKKCVKDKKHQPKECYIHIHGEIKPTKK
eukprot:403351521